MLDLTGFEIPNDNISRESRETSLSTNDIFPIV